MTDAVRDPDRHAVTVYDGDDDLVAAVAEFVAEGLASSDRVVVLATGDHRAAVEVLLVRRGIDVARATAAGDYQALDAAEVLGRFLLDGAPDPARFEAVVGGLIDAAAGGGHGVRAFGEMVALLWADGDADSALELERLWNRLALHRGFTLLCGYPTSALEQHVELAAVDKVCRLHSEVLPPRSYTEADDRDVGTEPDHVTRVFVSTPAAVRAARHWVTSTLMAWDQADLAADAALATSELATNAVRHAVSAFRASISRSGPTVRLAFEDLAPASPMLRSVESDSSDGRGVYLVAQVSARYGHEPTPTGKVVWAEFTSDVA